MEKDSTVKALEKLKKAQADKESEIQKAEEAQKACDDDKAKKNDPDEDMGTDEEESVKAKKSEDDDEVEESAKSTKSEDEEDNEDAKDDEDEEDKRCHKSEEAPVEKSVEEPLTLALNLATTIFKSLEEVTATKPLEMVAAKSVEAPKPERTIKSVIEKYNSSVDCVKIGQAMCALQDEFYDIDWNADDTPTKVNGLKAAVAEFVKILDNISADTDDQVTKSTEPEDASKGVEGEEETEKSVEDKSQEPAEPEQSTKSVEDAEVSKAVKTVAEPKVEDEADTGIEKSEMMGVIAKSISNYENSAFDHSDKIEALKSLSSKVEASDKVTDALVDEYQAI